VSPGTVDAEVVRRHLMTLERPLANLRHHCGRPVNALRDDDERWTVERGLQLCAQNALDIATHLAAGLGRGVPTMRARSTSSPMWESCRGIVPPRSAAWPDFATWSSTATSTSTSSSLIGC